MKKSMYKILCGAIAGGLLISAAGAVSANAENVNTERNRKPINFRAPMDRAKMKSEMREEMQNTLKEVLADEVKAGVITEEESEKVIEYLEKKAEEMKANFDSLKDMKDKFREMKENFNKEDLKERFNKEDMKEIFGEFKGMKDRGGRKDILEDIVTEGILTQEKADSIREKLHEKVQENREVRLKEKLNSAVEEGTITQEQSERIEEALKKLAEERKANFEAVKGMTDEERKEYFEKMREERTKPMDKLVEDGTLTEEEVDAVKGLFKGMRHHKKGRFKGFRK